VGYPIKLKTDSGLEFEIVGGTMWRGGVRVDVSHGGAVVSLSATSIDFSTKGGDLPQEIKEMIKERLLRAFTPV